MTEKLKQTIKEEIGKSPKEAQEVLNTFDWVHISEEIGKKFLLSEDEINDFQIETLLVLVGLEDVYFYAENIENNVGTTKDEATKMAAEVFINIIEPIKNTIEENIRKNLKEENLNWKQSIDFIISGGDYSAFMTSTIENSSKEDDKNSTETQEEMIIPVFPIRIEGLK